MSARTGPTGPWRITVPMPCAWLTANTRGQWEIARRVREWRNAAFYAAVQARPPKGLDRVRVDVLFRLAYVPVREIENLRPTLKAVIDGAVGPKRSTSAGYGIVPDDSDQHVAYGTYTADSVGHRRLCGGAQRCRCGSLVLTVAEAQDIHSELLSERFGPIDEVQRERPR